MEEAGHEEEAMVLPLPNAPAAHKELYHSIGGSSFTLLVAPVFGPPIQRFPPTIVAMSPR
jgi:hypothetical protein